MPPGSFQGTSGSWEPGDGRATFVRLRLPTVRPPGAAIRDLLVLGGLEDLGKFRSPVWGPKPPKSGFSRSWGLGGFVAVLKNVFSSKTERFSRFFSFLPLKQASRGAHCQDSAVFRPEKR